jgi:uncharacterized OsmC-like protein
MSALPEKSIQPKERTMTSAMTNIKPTKRKPVAMNGVDTPALFATINAVGTQPELAKFQFRATNHWIAGTHSESTMQSFFGAGSEQKHIAVYRAPGDHPAVLCGADTGPTPVEWLLHALATCLMAGVGTIASARGVKLNEVNGYQGIRVSFEIDGDTTPEQLEQIVMQSKARSAVFDVITNGVPVSIGVKTPAMA